ncbi:DUF927 domain-containing protein [Bradyrhizobium sp. 139]|uniref:DUF927 domain-containing protein n=1 Tax=Bradyrhizobium sp. 139 TaxID=2782616 RepID=UPI001FF8FB7E|nr:DUF927 domain-containing protein [Bradyrhizobium sp. 139]MCK1741382.1 DUF927 domain-containing protein [Bradyrhizobium sp. 139]
MPEHAQEYFAKVLAWPQDGDAPAYVNLHWSIDKLSEKTGKPIYTGRAVRSVAEAVSTVKWALSLPETKDIYVCLSTQREALAKKAKTSGREYFAPVRSQPNAVALKSIFLDLDAKGADKNSYASLPEAVTALEAFVAAASMPKPSAIVTSGGGLHVYWTFDRALTVAEWQPLANALAEATKVHDLKCDTACTIDAARILRVPGTFNRKLDVARPVTLAGGRTGLDYSVDRLALALAPFVKAAPAPALPPRVPLTGVSDLAAGVDMGNAAPADLKQLAKACGFIKEAVFTGGAAYTNPLWNLTTLIATFTKQSRVAAHVMAREHPGYSAPSTDELYDRKEREKAAKGLGWPSCRTISASGCTSCQSCPHFAAGKSPLNYGAAPPAPPPPPAAGAPSTPGAPLPPNWDMPPGYKRMPDNRIAKIMIDATTGSSYDEVICRYPLFDPSIQPSPLYTLNFHTETELGRTQQISLPTKEVAAKDGFNRTLWQQGVVTTENETKALRDFVVSWIEKLQKIKAAVVSSAPFGWSVDNKGNLEGFVYGGSLWTPTGDRNAANPDPLLARRYRPTGNRQEWIDAAKMITDQDRPELNAILASAFAGPLIRFTNQPGILLSTYSTASGIGKTTAMRVAQSVWGDPRRAMAGLDDTQNAVFGKVSQLRCLPLYWDELKGDDQARKFVKMVFQLTQGREKDRMTQSATLRESGSWQTMMVSASNDSIMDHVLAHSKQTLAGMYRVFEFEVAPNTTGKGQISSAVADRIVGKLDDHYAQIGLEYARYLGSNHKTIEQEVFQANEDLRVELGMENEERFWRGMLAALLKGAEYANAQGYTEINLKGLKGFLVTVLQGMRSKKAAAPVDMSDKLNISNVLAQFLNQHRARHTIQTNRIHTGLGRPPAGTIKILTAHPERLEAIHVHVGVDDKKLRISKYTLNQWFKDHEYSTSVMTDALEKEFGAKTTKARIASGTQYSGALEYLMEIDLAGSPHVNFLDEA